MGWLKDTFTAPRFWLGVVVTLALLFALFLSVPTDSLASAIQVIGPWPFLFAAFAGLFDALFVEPDKLRRIMKRLGFKVSFAETASLSYPATALGIAFPIQAEEVLKGRQLGIRYNLPVARAIGIVLLDRSSNIAAFIVLVAASGVILATGLSGSVGALLAVFTGPAVAAIIPVAASFLVRMPVLARIPLLSEVAWALRHTSLSFYFSMILYAVLPNLMYSAALAILAHAAGLDVPFATVIFWKAGASLISKIPVTLSGFGLREGSIALGLSPFGAQPAVVAVSLAFGVVTTLAPVLAVLFFQRYMRDTLEVLRGDISGGHRKLSDWLRDRQDRGDGQGH